MAERDEVAVVLDDAELGRERAVGTLVRSRSGTRSVLAFRYADGWLRGRDGFDLDPLLPLAPGDTYLDSLRGILGDCAPDRWGRLLMERREALAARGQHRRARSLDAWDFLVGVHDHTRMGALRFSGGGRYVSDEPLTIPPATRLRELEHWAGVLERDLPEDLGDEQRWVTMLLIPGSSLGGARPKATFSGEDDTLWLAKFPSQGDRHDVGAWEYVATRLAGAAGIAVPETRVVMLAGGYHTFCARRFDRTSNGRRLYASAMTLTGHQDGEESSYLEIAAAIERFAPATRIASQLEGLFRRAVFNVLASNRDDHLRNHGFLRRRDGWELAPAFDVNPAPDRREHAVSLDGTTHLPAVEALRDTASFYRIDRRRAHEVIAEVRRAVSGWSREARAAGIPRAELERMATAFEVDEPGVV